MLLRLKSWTKCIGLMKNKFITSLLASAALMGSVVAASSMDVEIDEARFGGNLLDIPTGERMTYWSYNMPGANAELLFTPFDFDMGDTPSEGFLREVFTPRLHVGTTISFDSHSPSSVYAGLTWHHAIGQHFFFESTFGAGLHDGNKEKKVIPGPKDIRGLGSPLLFRESVAIGANVGENMTVVLQLTHMSHAGLAGDDNAGQTDVALKFGRKF